MDKKTITLRLLAILAACGGQAAADDPAAREPILLVDRRSHRPAVPAPTDIRDTGKSRIPCIRPQGRSSRIYRRPDRTFAYWNGDAMWNRALPPLPAGSPARNDGIIAHNGDLYVAWQGSNGAGAARIVPDGTSYRILLEGDIAGPRVARQADRSWDLAADENNYAKGSFLAHALSDHVTTDPHTLQRAAGILELMGLSEARLERTSSPEEILRANPLVMFAVGQAFVETLPARLRDPQATGWTLHELKILLPDLAIRSVRPIAIHRPDGGLHAAVHADGKPVRGGSVPAGALDLVRYDNGEFVLRENGADTRYRSFFAAVEAGTRPAVDLRVRNVQTRENDFRIAFAGFIEGRSARPRFDHMIGHWIDSLQLGVGQQRGVDDIVRVARLRHALFDRHYPLGANEERLILETTLRLMRRGHDVDIEVVRRGGNERLASLESFPAAAQRIVIEADVDTSGRRVAYYQRGAPCHSPIPSRPIDDASFSPLIDVLLNAGDGKVRRALSRNEWDFQGFAESLLVRIAEDENALLPASLDRLVVRDPAILRQAESTFADAWTTGGRHYVRLRSLDGETQIVETRPTSVPGEQDLANYGDNLGAGLARLTERHGKWYPSSFLRSGFDPSSASFRHAAIAHLASTLPPGSPIIGEILGRVVDAVPYPSLLVALQRQARLEVSVDGQLMLVFDGSPTLRQPTRVYMPGMAALRAAPVAAASQRPHTPLGLLRQNAVDEPRLSGATPHAPPASAAPIFASLTAAEAPIGDYIAYGVGNRHIQALATARRLRTMVRTDDYIVLVGTTAGHSFTVALPVNPATMQLLESGGGLMADFPEGTRIVDDWFDVATTAADYPQAARARARHLQDQSMAVTYRVDNAPMTVPATRFVETILAGPVVFSTWNPQHDPISETRYVNYMRLRHEQNLPAVPAGLDWLQTPAERNEIARYFRRQPSRPGEAAAVEALLSLAVGADPTSPHAPHQPMQTE